MRHRTTVFAMLAGAVAASAALAQTATPRARTNVVVSSEPAKVTLSMRGADAKPYLAVTATGADVKIALKDMATKANLNVVLDPSAVGTFSGTVEAQPAETAIATVAKLANLSVKKFVVPDAAVATLTPDLGGQYVNALTTLAAGTQISDPATGKTLVVAATEPATTSGKTVYFVHGRISPFGAGARMRGPRQPGQPGAPGGQPGAAGGPGGAAQPSQANQAFVDSTSKSLAQMPLQQRVDTLRALQMQMFQNLSDADRAQLQQMGGGRGFGGGRGGFGGGRGGFGGGGGGNTLGGTNGDTNGQ